MIDSSRVPPNGEGDAETAGDVDELEGDVDRGPEDDSLTAPSPGDTPDDAPGESGDPGAVPD
ncbi:MAG: hypothetical protein JO250_07640 [Armatimonadetes bacterium]|nr:hypothetical protein [Armatimonadota bacterium]